MGKNKKNSSKKSQAAPPAVKSSVTLTPSADSAVNPANTSKSTEIVPAWSDPLPTVKVSEVIEENGNGKFEQVQEKGVNGTNGTAVEETNESSDVSMKPAATESGAEVETSTDDVGNQNTAKKKTNSRKKKASRSSSESTNGEETAADAMVAETTDPPSNTKIEAPIPVVECVPEAFVEDQNEKQDQLDQLMTEMKKSLSSSSNVSIPDLVTSNRVLSPTIQPELLPLDPFTEAIAKRETLLTHGLVIPCGWSWCETDELKAIYSSLVSQISSLEEEIPPEDRILHIYAPTELHCTVATLSSFKESSTYFASLDQSGPINGEIERREVMSLWNLALREYFAKNDCALFSADGSFPASVERIEICDTAVIFHFETGDAMNVMRNAVKYAREHRVFREYEITKGLSPYELTRLVHIPNITHSTFVRFRKRPSESLRKSLELIANSWIPVEIQMKGMQIVYENRPYMHLDPDSLTAFSVFPLSELESEGTNVESTTTACQVKEDEQQQPSLLPAATVVAEMEMENESQPLLEERVAVTPPDVPELEQKAQYEEIDSPLEAEEAQALAERDPEPIVEPKISRVYDEVDEPEKTDVATHEVEVPAPVLAELEPEPVAAEPSEEPTPAAPAVDAVETPVLPPSPEPEPQSVEVQTVEEVLVPEPAEEVKPSESEPVVTPLPEPAIAPVAVESQPPTKEQTRPVDQKPPPVATTQSQPPPQTSAPKPAPAPVSQRAANPPEKAKSASPERLPKSAQSIKTPSTSTVATRPRSPAEDSSFSQYALLAVGAATVLGIAFAFMRRR